MTDSTQDNLPSESQGDSSLQASEQAATSAELTGTAVNTAQPDEALIPRDHIDFSVSADSPTVQADDVKPGELYADTLAGAFEDAPGEISDSDTPSPVVFSNSPLGQHHKAVKEAQDRLAELVDLYGARQSPTAEHPLDDEERAQLAAAQQTLDTLLLVQVRPGIEDFRGAKDLVHTSETGLTIHSLFNEDRGGGTNGHHYAVFQDNQLQGYLEFQNGPIPQYGVNGLTNEALIAVVLHRTKHVNGLFPSSFNETAIAGLQQALDAFNARTADRKARQVEGTLQA